MNLCSELVQVVCDGSHGATRMMTANLEQISEHNLVILAEENLPQGSSVTVLCKSHELNGVVESAEYDEVLGNFIHVRLDSDSQWSTDYFKPEHLLLMSRVLEQRAHPTAA